ncbi:MAG: peptidyl-prolyl cis-trans isomerase, partial [Deltaproteobacteria bacterium]|nr:peptidyl-prolyl cis-trans isomerase [Deltaproteobacteria bacterium]
MSRHFVSCLLLAVGLLLASQAGAKENPVVRIETSMGTIRAELYPDKAPISVRNFLQYASDGFYNGTIFHRVIQSFMI